MPVKHFCLSCSKTFTTLSALRSHSTAKGHTPNPFICEECDISFLSLNALQSHLNSSIHSSESSRLAKIKSSRAEGLYCNECKRRFTDITALNRHLAYSPKHNWCFDCSHDFGSSTSLVQHQNSIAHRGRDFKCPFCESMFKSPSGIALHIESGCHTLTRHHVTAAVQAMQIVPNISIKQITGPISPPILRTYIATEASFNGSVYACYLCPKKCTTLASLNAHLNSPAHDDDEFRCPKCKTEFKLISGFVQHLESRSCNLVEPVQIDSYFNRMTGWVSRLLKF